MGRNFRLGIASASFWDRFGYLREYKLPFHFRDFDPKNLRRLVIGKVESNQFDLKKTSFFDLI